MATNFATQTPGATVETYLTNASGNFIFARSTVANLPTGAGYAVGCMIQASDTGDLYTNVGTTSAAAFSPVNGGIDTHPNKAAINSSATATAAQVQTGYITSTSAAGTTITLPTGSLLGAALNAAQGTTFDLYVDNTAGANTVTIAVGVNAVQSDWDLQITAATASVTPAAVTPLTVRSGVAGLARFTLMFSSATAYTFSRTA